MTSKAKAAGGADLVRVVAWMRDGGRRYIPNRGNSLLRLTANRRLAAVLRRRDAEGMIQGMHRAKDDLPHTWPDVLFFDVAPAPRATRPT